MAGLKGRGPKTKSQDVTWWGLGGRWFALQDIKDPFCGLWSEESARVDMGGGGQTDLGIGGGVQLTKGESKR